MRGRLVSPSGDLTDSYRDESVTSLSPLKTRHPRGDSPLSSRPPSSLSTVSSLSRPPTTLPSLDRLISFLDDELDDDPPPPPRLAASKARAAPPKTSTPPRTLPPMSPPPAPLHTHSKSMRVSPAPELTFIQRREDATMGSSSTGETPEEDDTLSPSQRTERSRRERTISFPEGDRAGSGTGHHATVGRAMGKGIESRMEGRGDESPSPRPGTMAELREKSLRESLVSGNGAGRPVEEREATERRVPSGDSVARLADEVLDEFDSIVSWRHPQSPTASLARPVSEGRPLSRLRNIPSPLESTSEDGVPQGSIGTRGDDPQRPRVNSGRQQWDAPESEGGDETRVKEWIGSSHASPPVFKPLNISHPGRFQGPQRRPPQHPSSVGSSRRSPPPLPPSQDRDGALLAELQDAKAYIVHLHSELRKISGAVVQLRSPAPIPPHPLPMPPPSPSLPSTFPPTQDQDSQAAWDVARHIIALLPTPSLSAPISLDSIARALQFTRDVDALVHGGESGRRDEDIFGEGNLESVGRRVVGWERAVRGGG